MKIEELLAGNGTSVFGNSVLQAAMKKREEERTERLCNVAVEVLGTEEVVVNALVSQIRQLRKQERELKDQVNAVQRASAYLKVTGNPLPLIKLIKGDRAVLNFCQSLNIDHSEDSCVVPKTWAPPQAQ